MTHSIKITFCMCEDDLVEFWVEKNYLSGPLPDHGRVEPGEAVDLLKQYISVVAEWREFKTFSEKKYYRGDELDEHGEPI